MSAEDEEHSYSTRSPMCILGIEHKPEEMTVEAWNKADLTTMSSIEGHLSNEVTYNVMDEKRYIGET